MKLLRPMANLIVADDDLIEINAGGKIIVAQTFYVDTNTRKSDGGAFSVDAGIRS